MPVKSLGGRTEPHGHFCRILVCDCLLSSSRAVFLALAEVNHSTLTIFALPLYKRRGTRPTDPITSLSGNKCLTIQPYWVWKINPFHSRALPVSSESSKADVTVIIIVPTSNIPSTCLREFIGYFQGLSCFYFFMFFFFSYYCQFILLFHISYFCWRYVCCEGVTNNLWAFSAT